MIHEQFPRVQFIIHTYLLFVHCFMPSKYFNEHAVHTLLRSVRIVRPPAKTDFIFYPSGQKARDSYCTTLACRWTLFPRSFRISTRDEIVHYCPISADILYPGGFEGGKVARNYPPPNPFCVDLRREEHSTLVVCAISTDATNVQGRCDIAYDRRC